MSEQDAPRDPPPGDRLASEDLLNLVYTELRALARARMRRERTDHSLQATDLVHEAYLRLQHGGQAEWAGRGHFFAAAAEAMRRILIEHARAKGRVKRGGDTLGRPAEKLTLTIAGVADLAAADADPDAVMVLEDAITALEQQDARLAQVVRLRFYAGLSVEETAEAMETSPRTVKRDWSFARAWLYSRLSGSDG